MYSMQKKMLNKGTVYQRHEVVLLLVEIYKLVDEGPILLERNYRGGAFPQF